MNQDGLPRQVCLHTKLEDTQWVLQYARLRRWPTVGHSLQGLARM